MEMQQILEMTLILWKKLKLIIFKIDGINRLIHNTYSLMNYNFYGIYNIPLNDKARKPLYEGLRTNITFDILFLVNSNERFVKHLFYIDPKACIIIVHT